MNVSAQVGSWFDKFPVLFPQLKSSMKDIHGVSSGMLIERRSWLLLPR